jgi:uncharacterized protein YggE
MRRSLAFGLVVVAVVAAVAATTLLGGGGKGAAVAADVTPSANGIVVDGLGRTTGTPDVLRVTLGVSVRRADVSKAMAAANARQAALRASLVRDRVAAKDLQTADVSIERSYDRRGRPNGYRVSETLTAKLRDLARAGSTITHAVQAGGNEALLQGVAFSLEDNKALLEQARDAAYDDARAKAERYARLSGRSLGEVQLVAETSAPVDLYRFDRAAPLSFTGASKAALPIDAGSEDVSVKVTVRWALR